jgi:hypothetical protein
LPVRPGRRQSTEESARRQPENQPQRSDVTAQTRATLTVRALLTFALAHRPSASVWRDLAQTPTRRAMQLPGKASERMESSGPGVSARGPSLRRRCWQSRGGTHSSALILRIRRCRRTPAAGLGQARDRPRVDFALRGRQHGKEREDSTGTKQAALSAQAHRNALPKPVAARPASCRGVSSVCPATASPRWASSLPSATDGLPAPSGEALQRTGRTRERLR